METCTLIPPWLPAAISACVRMVKLLCQGKDCDNCRKKSPANFVNNLDEESLVHCNTWYSLFWNFLHLSLNGSKR